MSEADKTGASARKSRAEALLAEGTVLRDAVDRILAAGTGGLIVLGERQELSSVSEAGFRFETPASAPKIAELAKMDGAILLDAPGETILGANVHLVPDDSEAASETGMRHRAAQRVSTHGDIVAVTVSGRRRLASVWIGGETFPLPWAAGPTT